MKKKKQFIKTSIAIIIAGIIGIQGHAQTTSASGALTNTCTALAGTSGANSTFIGCGAGYGSATGGAAQNTFIGDHSGFHNLGNKENVAVGYNALYTQSNSYDAASYNVAVGNNALYYNNSTTTSTTLLNGIQNTAVGHNALFGNTIGASNSALGFEALKGNTEAGGNVAIGYQALFTAPGFANGAVYSTYNTAVGYQALALTAPSSTTDGYRNTAIGYRAGYTNSTGLKNTFAGYNAGLSNTTGGDNVFVGDNAGSSNTTTNKNVFVGSYSGANNTAQSNSFLGYATGASNTSGSANVFIGESAGYYNVTGSHNTITGYYAGLGNGSYSDNTFYGYHAGNSTTGDGNTFTGKSAGVTNTTGTYNTCIGYGADVNANNLSNATALGNGAVVSNSGDIYMGNATINGVRDVAGFFLTSDGRIKFNVQENVKGLDFIKKLRPVTYQIDTKKVDDFLIQNMPDSIKTKHQLGMDFSGSTSKVHSGFIAQEVEQAAQQVGFASSIVHAPGNSTDLYSLSYEEMVVPLVKAVQQLDSTVTALQTQLNASQGARTTGSNNNPSTDVELVSKNAILYQNYPNPFGDGTIVKYFVPENSIAASIVFYDEFGNEIKNVALPNTGVTAELNLATMNLASGVYSYSLILNGKVIDTKKMIRNK